jgi:hypothetical protein
MTGFPFDGAPVKESKELARLRDERDHWRTLASLRDKMITVMGSEVKSAQEFIEILQAEIVRLKSVPPVTDDPV